MHFVFADSLALVEALCDALVLLTLMHSLRRFVRQNVLAESLALVEALL